MRWLISIGELVLFCWFVSLAINAAFQRAFLDPESPFRITEFHHAYIGAGLVVLGLLLKSVTGIFIELLGLVLTADDTYQHHVQTVNERFLYKSPLHQLFARYLWPLPFIQWLVAVLDRWWFVAVVFGLLALWWLT